MTPSKWFTSWFQGSINLQIIFAQQENLGHAVSELISCRVLTLPLGVLSSADKLYAA